MLNILSDLGQSKGQNFYFLTHSLNLIQLNSLTQA